MEIKQILENDSSAVSLFKTPSLNLLPDHMVGQGELLVGEQGEVGQVDGRLLRGPGLVQALQN